MTGKLYFSLLACCFVVGFSFVGLSTMTVSAAEVYTLTPAQTVALFGSDIVCKYYNGSDYVEGVLHNSNAGHWSAESTPLIPDSYFSSERVPWVTYTMPLTGSNSDPNFLTIEIQTAVSFNSTFEIHTGACVLARGNNGASSPPYSTSNWDFFRNGVKTQLPFLTSNGSLSKYQFDGNNYVVCICDMLFSSGQTISFGDINLYGSFNDSYFTLGLACPTISVGSGTSQGIVTTPSGGGGGGSSIDYSSMLQQIIEKLDAIAQQNGYTDSEQDDIDDTNTSIADQTLTVEQIESAEGSLWVSPDSAAIGRWSAGVDAGEFPDMSLSGSYVKHGVTFGDSAFDVRYTALLDDASERASPAGSFSDFFSLLGDFPFFIIGVGLYLFSVILHTG